jgi:hypothetical protein
MKKPFVAVDEPVRAFNFFQNFKNKGVVKGVKGFFSV